MDLHRQEHPIADVMAHFVKGFDTKKHHVVNYEWLYDPHKGKVMFTLFIEPRAKGKKSTR